MSEGKLIRFPKAPDDAVKSELEVDRPGWQDCRHPRPLTLDVEAHQLLCEKCGQAIDAFDFLVELTGKWERYNAEYRSARTQAQAASARLIELERLEKNAKARIRKCGVTLSTKDARAARDQFRALGSAIANIIGDREEAVRIAKRCGFDPDETRRVLGILDERVELKKKAG